MFRNFDEHGNPFARPNTLLIDSEQLESGEALDDNFRAMAADEIDRFRREIIERTGDQRAAEKLTDTDLLREVMNTVGKEGRLGESIRCVVSVAMLTEGWDANTVTHVLGVRAFGTQLLCEQVIGRALRRQSYDLIEEGEDAGKFNVEYADVLGIPFDFTAKPVVAPPQPPRETVLVRADTDYNEESFFVRQAYFLGANDPYTALKTTLKAEIDPEAWATLNRDTSRAFPKPKSGRIAVKVINHLGDEVMKVFRVA